MDASEGAAFISGFRLITKRAPVTFLAGYAKDGHAEILFEKTAAETNFGRKLFILVADFNITPEEMQEAPWISRLNASILHFGEPRCKSREGIVSEIDYLIVSNGLL